MRAATRRCVSELAVKSNNSKALEICDCLNFLESEVERLSGSNPSEYDLVETTANEKLFNSGR